MVKVHVCTAGDGTGSEEFCDNLAAAAAVWRIALENYSPLAKLCKLQQSDCDMLSSDVQTIV